MEASRADNPGAVFDDEHVPAETDRELARAGGPPAVL